MPLDQITQKLWIGGKDDAIHICREFEVRSNPFPHIGLVHELGILNVAEDVLEYPHSKDILYIHSGLTNGPPDHSLPKERWGKGNTPEQYLNAIYSLGFLYRWKKNILVHCHAGASRSAFVLCCFLSRYTNIHFGTIERFITAQHHINIHPIHKPKLGMIQAMLIDYPINKQIISGRTLLDSWAEEKGFTYRS